MSEAALERRIEALEARLRAAEDVQAIERLKARYAELVDARYTRKGPKPAEEIEPIARELVALFAPDAVWEAGGALGTCRGHEALFERFMAPTLQWSWHFFLKPRIAVEGDTARATWDLFSPCTTAEGRAMWMTGVEHDEYVRLDGVWVHRSMKLDVVFMAPYERGWGPRPS